MAKNIRESGDDVGVQPSEPLSSDLPPQTEDDREGADVPQDDGLIAVVVRKGHTLYHNGEKYPATSRARIPGEEAEHLKKRGVVLIYSELVEQVAGYVG